MRFLVSGRPSSGHCVSFGPFSAVLAYSGHSSPAVISGATPSFRLVYLCIEHGWSSGHGYVGWHVADFDVEGGVVEARIWKGNGCFGLANAGTLGSVCGISFPLALARLPSRQTTVLPFVAKIRSKPAPISPQTKRLWIVYGDVSF